MEEKKNNWLEIANLIIFWALFASFAVLALISLVNCIKGQMTVYAMLMRFGMLFVMAVPFFIRLIFKITFPPLVTIGYYIFMWLSAFVGTFLNVYVTFEYWDIILHCSSGIYFGLLGIFILRYTVFKEGKVNNFFLGLFIIIFAISVGTIWEFWEFFSDGVLGSTYQGWVATNGELLVGRPVLFDTIYDLVADTIGGIIAAIIAVTMSKKNEKFINNFEIKIVQKQQ